MKQKTYPCRYSIVYVRKKHDVYQIFTEEHVLRKRSRDFVHDFFFEKS